MFEQIKSLLQVSLPRRMRFTRGRYDAATSTENNRRHWANADALSADAANSPAVKLAGGDFLEINLSGDKER